MTYLIRKAYNYSESGRKRERKLKKYHLNIPSLALIRNDDRITRSKAFESLMASRLEAEYFWRNSRKDEVDIVLRENDDLLPIEVKYKNKKEYSGLLKFMNKFNVNKGIVITRNLKDTEKIDDKKIKYIPGWKYLLRKD